MTTNEAQIQEAGRCDICGTPVVRGYEPVTVAGWYGGHQFVWVDGQVKLLRVRCPNHPFDPFAEQEV